MNILSLFDGMSGGQIALARSGIKVNKYFASEVDKYAIDVTQANFKDTIQLGDVAKINADNLPEIGLLIGGSPCQGFSFAGKQLNFEDPRSKLFFEYMRLLKELKPKYFILENVRMKQEFQDIISKYLGVQPIFIDSALVSAQNRKRLYWTNIPYLFDPEDKGILLRDIVHENCLVDREKAHAVIASIGRTTKREYFKKNQGQMVCEIMKRTVLSDKEVGYMLRGNEKWQQAGDCRLCRYTQYEDRKSFSVTANVHKGVPYNCFFQALEEYIVPFDDTLKILDKDVEEGKLGYFRKDSHANRVYYLNNKAVTLLGDAGGGAAKMGQYIFGEIKKNYFQYDVKGKGHGSQDQRAYYLDGKHGTLPSTSGQSKCKVLISGKKFYTLTEKEGKGVLIEGYIRKLTPVECERLQTVPDNYTNYVSNTQRYKMLGNGFTVDVIAHLLKGVIP
mgnify:CR=1 FL=1